MHIDYNTKGTCSVKISFDLEGDTVHNVKFLGGCPGNLAAISKLLEGQKADYIVKTLKGNKCGNRPTSCADQLACAIEEHLK